MRAEVGYWWSTFGPSERRACGLLEMAVSSYRYRSRRRGDEELRGKRVALAGEKPRFGYRRLQVLLRQSGERASFQEKEIVKMGIFFCQFFNRRNLI